MQRIVGILVVFAMLVAACSGTEPDPSAGASGGDEVIAASVDLSGHVPVPGEQAAATLAASLQEAFIAELAKNGVTSSIDDLASLAQDFAATMEEALVDAEAEFAGITGADVPAEETLAEPARGVLLLARPPRARLAASSDPALTTVPKDVATQFHKVGLVVTLASGGQIGLVHEGPGDYGPSTIELKGNPLLPVKGSLVMEKRGSKITLQYTTTLGAEPPKPGVKIDFRVVIDACPDEAGEASVEFSTLTQYLGEVDGRTISGELRMDGIGVVTVGDDAAVSGYDLDLTGSRATRTTKDGTVQPGASFVELTMPVGPGGSGQARGRHSSDATVAEVESLGENMSDTIAEFFPMVVAMMQHGWSEGQCIELEVEVPAEVGLGSRTTAKVKVNHRYEERVLQLPITGELTAGGESIDPGEATGDPAEFTYTAPNESNKTATLTFEVRSKRGADKKTVDVTTRSMAIDVAFSGNLSYSMSGFTLNGMVTIPAITLLEYGGDDPELKGKWTGDGPVEISMSAEVEGCGTATGTQQGGAVTIVGTPHDEDGTVMLSLFAEEMEGGDATLTCGSGGATVAGVGLSIGGGLINLGNIVIPAEPGTYPFESSGVAAGMVQYVVEGEAVVTESADFPGSATKPALTVGA